MGNNPYSVIGFVKEYYHLDTKKYLGDAPLQEPDREVYGYEGRTLETVAATFTTSKKKVLKSGLKCFTELQMICGRVTKKEVEN
jgi:hypothetical protein